MLFQFANGQVQVFDPETQDIVYRESREQFEQDIGALVVLPAGMATFTYDSVNEYLCYFDSKGNAHPAEGEGNKHSLGDEAIEQLPRLVAASRARQEAARAAVAAAIAARRQGA